jgi:hypothetical protein
MHTYASLTKKFITNNNTASTIQHHRKEIDLISSSLTSQLTTISPLSTDGADTTTALFYRPFLMGRRWIRFIYWHLEQPARRIRELERLAWLEVIIEPFVRSVYAVAPRRQLLSPRRRCPEPIDSLFRSRLVMLDRFQAACKQRLQRDSYREKQRQKKLAQFVVLRPAIKAFVDGKRRRQELLSLIASDMWALSAKEEPSSRQHVVSREITVWGNLQKYWSDVVDRSKRVRQIQRVGRRYLDKCRQRAIHYQKLQQLKHQQLIEEAYCQQRDAEKEHQQLLQNAEVIPTRDPRRASLLRLRTMAIGTIASALKQWYIQNAAAVRIQFAYRTAQQRAESRYERQVAELERIEKSRTHLSTITTHHNNFIYVRHQGDVAGAADDALSVHNTSRISFTADTADHLPSNYPSFNLGGDDTSSRLAEQDTVGDPHHSEGTHDGDEDVAEKRRILICQRAARVFLARASRQRLLTQEMDARRKLAATFVIMGWFQRSKTRRVARLARDRLLEEERRRIQGHRRTAAAERIQRNFRGFIGRKHAAAQANRFAESLHQEHLRDAARVIIRRWKRFVARRHHLRHNRSDLEQLDAKLTESVTRAGMSHAVLAFSRGSQWFGGTKEPSTSPIHKQSSPIYKDDAHDGLFYTLHIMPTSAPSSTTPTPREHRDTTPRSRSAPKTATPNNSRSRVAGSVNEGDIDWDSCMDPSADSDAVSPPQGGLSTFYDNPTTAQAAFTPPQHRRWVPPAPSPATPRGGYKDNFNDDTPPLVEIPSVFADDEVADMWGDIGSPNKGLSSPPPEQRHPRTKKMTSSEVIAAAEELTGRTTTPHRHQQQLPTNSSPPRSEQRRQHQYSSARQQMRSTEVIGDVWGPSVDKRPEGPVQGITNGATRAAPSSAPANRTINLSDAHVGAPLRDVTGRVPNHQNTINDHHGNVTNIEADERSASRSDGGVGRSTWHSYQEESAPYYPPTRPLPVGIELGAEVGMM